MTGKQNGSILGEHGAIPILVITSRPESLQSFLKGFRHTPGVDLRVVDQAADAMEAVKRSGPALAVVDEEVNGVAGLELIRMLMRQNAFINTAVLSDAAEEDFHLHSEGLGILSKLPKNPDETDAAMLLNLLKGLRVFVPTTQV